MNRVTRSSVALAALSLASIVSFASKASADTATLTVSTIVPQSCSFAQGTKTPGTLGQDFANNTLDSNFTGGLAATIDLTCNNLGSKLTLTSSALTTSGVTQTPSSTLVTVTHPNGTITNNGTTISAPVPITTIGVAQTVEVDAKAVYANAIEAGTYTFTVNLTANP